MKPLLSLMLEDVLLDHHSQLSALSYLSDGVFISITLLFIFLPALSPTLPLLLPTFSFCDPPFAATFSLSLLSPLSYCPAVIVSCL